MHAKNSKSPTETFKGFASPTSNTTYTPNQFFDVCLPNHSRGVVRLVAYMLRKTLGWCDKNGNPQHETVTFSYGALEKHAGLSHGMIRLALDEATKGGFIRCVRQGQASGRLESGHSAVYELAWDESGEYVKNPKAFKGFFAGDGNRTYIPNQFFDEIVPSESLATIRIVGAIIRFSIGFVNKYGHRRQHVALSYLDIQRYAKIASPRILSKTIRNAIAKNYVERVEEGYFDPNGGMMSRSAHYALKWQASATTTPKSEAAENHSEKYSGGTPKSEVADHTEKYSGIQIKQRNKTNKEQTGEAAATFSRLKEVGFDERSARAIASSYPFERVDRQIRWIDRRRVRRNRLGMLRRAIEEDWTQPKFASLAHSELGQPNNSATSETLEESIRRIERRLSGSSPTS
jgi:hypothetical protein